jgi:uncharacterized protein (TIGR02246 family)
MARALKRIGTSSIVILVVVFVSTLSFPACGPSPETMIEEAKALDARFEEAFNNEDVEAMVACYWDDPEVVSMPPAQMIVKGIEGVREDFQTFLEGTNVKKFKLRKPQYRVLGDAVLGWGKFRLTTVPSLGPEVTIDGRYVEIVEKKDGKWVYVMDHASVPMSPETAEALGEQANVDKKKR